MEVEDELEYQEPHDEGGAIKGSFMGGVVPVAEPPHPLWEGLSSQGIPIQKIPARAAIGFRPV